MKRRKQKRAAAPPYTVREWLSAAQERYCTTAEERIVCEVVAKHAKADGRGGFTFEDDDDFKADAVRALVDYWAASG